MSLASMALSWRKIKHDLKSELTEASLTGAGVSIATGLVMIYLVFSQISEYRTLNSQTTVALDHFSSNNLHPQATEEDLLQINFNVSFPRLSCEYASVDAMNFMGTHDAGLAASISKIHLDAKGRQLGPHKDRKEKQHSVDEVHEGEQKSLQLTTDSFDSTRRANEVMIVNFYTPWCHWCQKLEPVWEKTAVALQEKFEQGKIGVAKVDCTAEDAESLCTTHGIDAFPTIMVFRAKYDTKDKEHERYHGERTVEAVVAWAETLVKQVNKEIPMSRVVDYDNDGEKDSHNGVGCMVAGKLHVQKSPGTVVIQAVSGNHEFNWATMDVTHTVNHLSFGPFLSETAWIVLPPDIAQAVGSLDDKSFAAEDKVPTTHEHYVKVVKNVVELPPSWGIQPVEAHGYVVHSNRIQRFAEVPTVRINYDILPILVHVKASYESTYHFFTQLCAIVGGMFTISGMVAWWVEGGLSSLLGKSESDKST